ncbi:MAG: hypothetical protein J5504_10385 [Butyrivibrio sp.]|nr:hypothetical protein [Butyrivibrio sp.]
MVDVDKLNEEIKEFGVVVDKMKDLPEIYEKVQVQLDVCREASNELKMAREDMEKFMTSTTQTIDQYHKDTDTKLTSVEHNLDQKLDRTEVSLRDRVALSESNLNLAITNLTHTLENTAAEINQRLDSDAAENKKRFIIITVCVCVSIILGIVKFFV